MTRQERRITAVVLPAMVLPTLAALGYFLMFPEGAWMHALYSGVKVFAVVWPVAAVLFVLRERLPIPDWRAGRHRRALLSGAVAGAVIVLVLLLLLLTPLREVIEAGIPAMREKAAAFGMDNALRYWTFALLLSVMHAGLEEYYWRWFVFGRLARILPAAGAHGLAAISFASHHVVGTGVFFGWGWGLLMGLGVAVGGVVWSLMLQRQGTLTGAWLSHMIVDLGIMGIGWWMLFG